MHDDYLELFSDSNSHLSRMLGIFTPNWGCIDRNLEVGREWIWGKW